MKKIIITLLSIILLNPIIVYQKEQDDFEIVMNDTTQETNIYKQLLNEKKEILERSDFLKDNIRLEELQKEIDDFKAYILSLKQYDKEFLLSMRYSEEIAELILDTEVFNDELIMLASPSIYSITPTFTKTYLADVNISYITVTGGFYYSVVMLGNTQSHHNYAIDTVPLLSTTSATIDQLNLVSCDSNPQNPYSYSCSIQYWYATSSGNGTYTKSVSYANTKLAPGSINFGFTSAVAIPGTNTEGSVDRGNYTFIYKVPNQVRTVFYKAGYGYRTNNLNSIWQCIALGSAAFNPTSIIAQPLSTILTVASIGGSGATLYGGCGNKVLL